MHAGVASGDPFTGSVILWTRVTPASNQQNGAAAVDWAVSKDRTFAGRKIISRGTTFTSKDVDFTVKVISQPGLHDTMACQRDPNLSRANVSIPSSMHAHTCTPSITAMVLFRCTHISVQKQFTRDIRDRSAHSIAAALLMFQ